MLQIGTVYEDGLIEAKFTMSEECADKIRHEEYKKIKNRIVKKGFRKGKIPLSIAENMVGIDSLYSQRLSNIMMKELLNENIMPYQYIKFDISKDLSVDAQLYPLQNNIKFNCDVNTLSVVEEKIKEPEVTEEEIKIAKDILRKQNSTAKEYTSRYKARINDDIVVDFKVQIEDDKEVIEKKNHSITLGLGLLDTKIEDTLVGIKAKEKRNVEVEIKGIKYKYEFICTKVVKIDLISIEELLNIMNIENEDALDEKLKKELFDNKKKRMAPFVNSRTIAIDKLIDNLKKNSNFELNEYMLDNITKNIESENEQIFMKNVHRNNYTMRSLLLAAGNELKIKVDNEEVNELLKKENKKEIDDIDKINAGASILINKVMEKLISKRKENEK